MTFKFILEKDTPCNLTYLTGDGEFIIRIPIGYDAEEDTVYVVFVALSPVAGGHEGTFELIFSIIEADI